MTLSWGRSGTLSQTCQWRGKKNPVERNARFFVGQGERTDPVDPTLRFSTKRWQHVPACAHYVATRPSMHALCGSTSQHACTLWQHVSAYTQSVATRHSMHALCGNTSHHARSLWQHVTAYTQSAARLQHTCDVMSTHPGSRQRCTTCRS